jgi:endonuclease YncB( thermonuclease family)
MSRVGATKSLACGLAFAFASAMVLSACGSSKQTRRYDRKQAQEALSRLESPGLVIGEFSLASKGVVDGDTIKVRGLDTSLRLLAIDTEETYKRDADRRASDSDFDKYLRDKRGDKSRPIKAATPLGEDAKKYGKKFFEGVSRVRLERDHPKEIRGRYGRYLAYAFAEKNGVWVNYNVESVRAGMTPYFTKYGFSRRFHDDFIAAEKEAQEKQIGIWKPGCECYPDYPERTVWWNARAEFILEFEREASSREDHIVLTNWDALRNIEAKVGQEVTVLGLVGDIRFGEKGPSRALLSRQLFNDFPAVFFDKDVFISSTITQYKGEFVAVTGVVNKYKNKYNNKEVLQIMVSLPSQVKGSRLPLLEKPGETVTPPEPSTSVAPTTEATSKL